MTRMLRWSFVPLMVAAIVAPVTTVSHATTLAPEQQSYRISRLPVPHATASIAPRWNPCRVVRYRVNPSALPVPPARQRTAARHVTEAFRQLSAATGITTKRIPLKTERAPRKRPNGKLTVPAGTITVTFMRPSKPRTMTNVLTRNPTTSDWYAGYGSFSTIPARDTTGHPAQQINRGVLAVNADQYVQHPWGYRSPHATGMLLLHELGHVFGLHHVSDPTQVMWEGRISLSQSPTAAYQTGDLAQLTQVGAKAGCLRQP